MGREALFRQPLTILGTCALHRMCSMYVLCIMDMEAALTITRHEPFLADNVTLGYRARVRAYDTV